MSRSSCGPARDAESSADSFGDLTAVCLPEECEHAEGCLIGKLYLKQGVHHFRRDPVHQLVLSQHCCCQDAV